MEALAKGWFSEVNNDLWPGQCLSLKFDKVIEQETSQFQEITVVDTTNHGRALILDGIIQCCQHDEFAYHEMISFLPLCAHPAPRKVLIVGGGDGGVARETTKHPYVTEITQVEIDPEVIEVSKRHLPFLSAGFASPKLTNLVVGDGFDFLRCHKNEYDVIITDSSDPVGPAEQLFTESYYELLKAALRPGGIACSQTGDPWTNLDHISATYRRARHHFDVVKLALVNVPTYPSGTISFLVGGEGELEPATPKLTFDEGERDKMALRCYNDKVHEASFVLPNFIQKALKK